MSGNLFVFFNYILENYLYFSQGVANTVIFLYLLWFLIVITSIIVVFTTHPIHSILALIAVFIEVGALLLFLGLEYIAFVFLVVYVGAIAVLFLFVTMMLNIRQLHFNISILAYLPATIFIVVSFFFNFIFLFFTKHTGFYYPYKQYLVAALMSNPFKLYCRTKVPSLRTNFTLIPMPPLKHLHKHGTINVADVFYTTTNLEAIANCLYTYFYLSFIASAIVLLVAMIGSISLTLYHKSNIRRQSIDKQWLRDFVVVLKS